MGLFQRLFAKKRPENEKNAENISVSQELLRLRELDAFMRALLNADHFVAKSEYRSKLSEYADLSAWFQVLKTSGTLEDYCKKQGVSSSEIATILNRYQSFETLVDSQNDRFIKSKMISENFTTMRSELDDFKQQIIDTRTKKTVTIQSEMMRSNQEVEIANFLYLNGIEYEYEPLYRYDILFARKPYTPDFRIWQGDREAYLEHFGISEDGRNNRFSEDELQAYKGTSE